MPAEDYSEGVSGKGQKWKSRSSEEESRQNYQSGATQEASDEYESNAGNAGSRYAEGVAEYIGTDPANITVDDDYESGASQAGGAWRQGVSGAGDRWAEGIGEVSASDWEDAASAAASEWLAGYTEGVQR